MMNLSLKLRFVFFGVALAFPAIASSQEGTLKLSVHPKQAYTFVDGKAFGPGNRSINLPLGPHEVIVANYGYDFYQKEVTIDSEDRSTVLKVNLEPSGAEVSGPRGRIQIELGELGTFTDAGKDAVLLNGKTVNYFVGHVDEFNHNIHWHQELIVPPGEHLVTVTREGKEVWSGTVPVAADQRVIVTISNGKRKVKDWPRGTELGAVSRFKAGVASATVVVAPVTGVISTSPPKIDCGQTSLVKWSSTDAKDADVSHMSPVPVVGERTVSPKETTTYDFTAHGPGGTAKSSATIEVNPTVQASLTAEPTEVQYRRIGDKTIQQQNVAVNWSTTNADTQSVTPFGSVGANGSKTVTVTPTQTGDGAINEAITYALTATNACGGSETKTTTVHVTGSIEPIPQVLLQSIFFPTDYPSENAPSAGLVPSQQESLTALAAGFMKYLEYDPDARLSLSAYADGRGSSPFNQSLSERRAASVKDFLVSKGIAQEKIETASFGREKPLDKDAVNQLQLQNPNPAPERRAKDARATWLAYNRRVDIVLQPKNVESLRFYPNGAPDSEILWQLARPRDSAIGQNQ
ncbi:MAG TPA: OmpA family protein [Candidatus Acidoferrum sp.]|nr:OmpA family protein [Candidatus Acidoferrum sp.]